MKIRSKLILWFLIFSIFILIVGFLSVIMSEELLKKTTEIGSDDPILNMRNGILVLLFILLIISLLTGVFILHSISRPIIILKNAVSSIGRGKSGIRVSIKSNDELGDLASTFNHMANELEKSQFKVRRYAVGLEGEVKKRTKDLNETIKKLKELDKMKSEFLSTISHELRTPLTPIRGQLERLLTKRIAAKERGKLLNMILRNSVRLDRLINDLLAVNRIQSNRLLIAKRPEELNIIVKEAIENQEILAKEKGIVIVNKVPILNVPIDRDRILEIFINLINNAIKYSEKGSIIIGAKKQDKYILVSVEDYGIGVAKEDINKLFKIFSQVKPEKPGVGLGLFICKGIMSAHGGKIWVKSEIGKGSTFYFTIPLK